MVELTDRKGQSHGNPGQKEGSLMVRGHSMEETISAQSEGSVE